MAATTGDTRITTTRGELLVDTNRAVTNSDVGLPTYSAHPEHYRPDTALNGHSEHTFHILDGHERAWCILKLQSRAPASRSLPVFVEGDPITGAVELDLHEPDSINAVIVTLRGLIVYSGYDSKVFMSLSQTLWRASTDDRPTSSFFLKTSVEKLSGKHSWPFSITLPQRLSFSIKEAKDLKLSTTERLPPNFEGKGWSAFINYQITLNIKRGSLLRTDSEVTTLVGYVPATRPNPPSHLRGLAYQERTPILGPNIDPEGWGVFPEVQVKGKLFKVVDVMISLSLALAIPLSYTRGTAIPCALTIKSSNKQAVDLFSTPEAPAVYMRRKMHSAIGLEMAGSALAIPGSEDSIPFARASWHPPQQSDEAGSDIYIRTILGELHIPHDLVPTFKFGRFDCRYVVDVYPPEAVGFEPASGARLSRSEVIVTSMLPNSPQLRAYLSPGYYDTQRMAQIRDLNAQSRD